MRMLLCGAFMLALAGAAGAQETVTYSYDVHGRLVAVNRSTGANTAYAYSGGDSRTSKVTTGGTALLAADIDPASVADAEEAEDRLFAAEAETETPDEREETSTPEH